VAPSANRTAAHWLQPSGLLLAAVVLDRASQVDGAKELAAAF
jgi:hypothetical protein